MNDLYKKLFTFLFALCVMLGVALFWAIGARNEAVGELEGRDRLTQQYRNERIEAERIGRELAERNQRLESGLDGIAELATGNVGDIRKAIGILAGVKSILEALEADGLFRDTHSVGGGYR